MGHIYQQTVIDTYSKIGFAKLYDRKNALVAADMLNDRVIPFFEQHDLKLMRMLTDRGTEYCGNRENHEYELYLAVEDIDHSKIKAKSPQTNGICERFNRTVQNEFYAIAFRKKIYTSIEQLQADLDMWMNSYNTQRTHSGKYCFGKTPMQTFIEGIAVARKYQLQNQEMIKPNEQDNMLNDRVIPFFEQHDLKLMRMLTDRGTEYCGNRENHEYELYLAVEDIDHSKIKAKSPQTNGICERFNRTVQNEFYAIAFRKKIYTSIEQLQADLDMWMNSYNTQRTHSGKYCFGKTPMQTFIEGIAVARKYQLQNQEMIKPNEQDKISFGCEDDETCVTSQQTSDSFFVR